MQGGQLDHRLGLAFEEHGQHDQMPRHRLTQARVHADVIGRDIGQVDALLFQGALADETFTNLECLQAL